MTPPCTPVTLLALAALPLLGCGERIEDVGTACLWGADRVVDPDFADRDATVDADEPGVVLVVFDACTGDDFERESCEATVVGQTLEVTASARRTGSFGPTANRGCDSAFTTCERPALGEGTWTLEYGGSSQPFEVPYDGPVICAGIE